MKPKPAIIGVAVAAVVATLAYIGIKPAPLPPIPTSMPATASPQTTINTSNQTITGRAFRGTETGTGLNGTGFCIVVDGGTDLAKAISNTTIQRCAIWPGDRDGIAVTGYARNTQIIDCSINDSDWSQYHKPLIIESGGQFDLPDGYGVLLSNVRSSTFLPWRVSQVATISGGDITIGPLGAVLLMGARVNVVGVAFKHIPKPDGAPYWSTDAPALIVAGYKAGPQRVGTADDLTLDVPMNSVWVDSKVTVDGRTFDPKLDIRLYDSVKGFGAPGSCPLGVLRKSPF